LFSQDFSPDEQLVKGGMPFDPKAKYLIGFVHS
jgi:hypothetical protein